MIKKKYKLNTEDFKYKYTSCYNGDYINVRVHYNNDLYNKYTVTVSKKVAKRSVDRNSLKRKIYNILETYIKNKESKDIINNLVKNPNSKQALYMIIVKKPFENKDIESIDKDIKTLFDNTSIKC